MPPNFMVKSHFYRVSCPRTPLQIGRQWIDAKNMKLRALFDQCNHVTLDGPKWGWGTWMFQSHIFCTFLSQIEGSLKVQTPLEPVIARREKIFPPTLIDIPPCTEKNSVVPAFSGPEQCVKKPVGKDECTRWTICSWLWFLPAYGFCMSLWIFLPLLFMYLWGVLSAFEF